jgi:hypothetical protein
MNNSKCCILLCDSQAPQSCVPTFRITVFHLPGNQWRWNRHSVPKRRHVRFRRRGIAQKKEYKIHNKEKVWNEEFKVSLSPIPASYQWNLSPDRQNHRNNAQKHDTLLQSIWTTVFDGTCLWSCTTNTTFSKPISICSPWLRLNLN